MMNKSFLILLFLSIWISVSAHEIEGRWDMDIKQGDKTSPAWLEVIHSGHKRMVGQFLYVGGSARPISEIKMNGNKFSFSIPPQWDQDDQNLLVEGEVMADKISGTVVEPNGKKYEWTGVRAPALIKTLAPLWSKARPLFNGKNLDGWHADREPNQWIAENGILKNPKSGANLISNEKFTDFKLHLEFKVPENGNSGIYLRGRHEIQVSDSKIASIVDLGGIYGLVKPLFIPANIPNVWHSFDITLIGRVLTVVLDGQSIIHKNEIPGITGGALDSHEAEPGPIYFQGDHTAVEYRNIRIAEARTK
jgi:hypothetical protein